MLWHNIKLTFRNLFKNLTNSSINILGLSVGMATVILIMLYVQNELSYDKFNSKHERIHRMYSTYHDNTGPRCMRLTSENFSSKIPEVEEVTQVYNYDQPIDYRKNRFTEFSHLYVDSNFCKIFDLEFLYGHPQKALSKLNGLVLTDECSKIIFGEINSIGKQVTINESIYTVEGIVKKLPITSHYKFDILTTMESNPWLEELRSLEFITYILFKENINTKLAINKSLVVYNQIIQNWFTKYGYESNGNMEPLTDIHLHSTISNYLGDQGDIVSILVLSTLAMLVLLIALINFINIMTVQYEAKMGEIGLRKAIGANRIVLIKQFLGSSFLYSFVALILGIILSEIFLNNFNVLIDRDLTPKYFHNPSLLLGLIGIFIFTGFLSGVYPALYLTKFHAAEIIKGNLTKRKGSLSFTKILVIVQFTISISLISSLLIIRQQTNYLESADLGFKPENVMGIVSLSQPLRRSFPAIKEELSKIPAIQSISASDHFPGGGASGQGFYLLGKEQSSSMDCDEYRVQADYFETLGIEFKEGRSFNEDDKSDRYGIIINEAAAKMIDTEHILGSKINYADTIYTIQGIVKNFHFRSLRSKIAPLLFSNRRFGLFTILIKYNTSNYKELEIKIESVLRKFDPSYNLNVINVEKSNRDRYHQERRTMKIAMYTSILSIIIALIGLYSLSLFMIQKRTKEIGIRKINGASITQISKLFLGLFSRWILMAFVIAIPISWICMNQWLDGFVRKIDIGVLPFLISGGATLLIALTTVFYHTWKSANQNPIESLRYE